VHQPVVRGAVESAIACEFGDGERAHRIRHDIRWRVVDEPGGRERALQALVECVAVACVELFSAVFGPAGTRDAGRREAM
jgi:hypothetical protein